MNTAQHTDFSIGDTVVVTTDDFKQEGVVLHINLHRIKPFIVEHAPGFGGTYGAWELQKTTPKTPKRTANERMNDEI